MKNYLRTLPGRLVLAGVGLFLSGLGLAVFAGHSRASLDFVIFAPLLGIVALLVAVGLSMERHPIQAAQVVIAAPLLAFVLFPAMLVAREWMPVLAWPALALGLATIAAAIVPRAGDVMPARADAPHGARLAR